MRPESRKYLWDAREATQRLQAFTPGQSLDDYLGSALLRSAVERQYEIIGEALRQLVKADPETAAMVPELARIVAFRNILIHGYATVDDRLVWGLLRTRPSFRGPPTVTGAEESLRTPRLFAATARLRSSDLLLREIVAARDDCRCGVAVLDSRLSTRGAAAFGCGGAAL